MHRLLPPGIWSEMLQLSVSWLTNILVRKAPDNLVNSSACCFLANTCISLLPTSQSLPSPHCLPILFFFFSAHNVGLCLLSLCGRFDFVTSQSLLSLLAPFLHLARFQWFSFLQSINSKSTRWLFYVRFWFIPSQLAHLQWLLSSPWSNMCISGKKK